MISENTKKLKEKTVNKISLTTIGVLALINFNYDFLFGSETANCNAVTLIGVKDNANYLRYIKPVGINVSHVSQINDKLQLYKGAKTDAFCDKQATIDDNVADRKRILSLRFADACN